MYAPKLIIAKILRLIIEIGFLSRPVSKAIKMKYLGLVLLVPMLRSILQA